MVKYYSNIKFIIILSSISFSLVSISQNYQTVEEIDDNCAILGFASNEEAELAVDKILDAVGLYRNFTIQECPNINNAVAKNIEVSEGYKERYILYDNAFFNNIDTDAGTNWASMSILAHEIGHHLNGHVLLNSGSTYKIELEADYFSGVALAKLGATLEEAQSALKSLVNYKASETHPPKAQRLTAIEKGWNVGKGFINEKTVISDIAEQYYEEGLKAFKEFDFKSALDKFIKAAQAEHPDAYYYLSIQNAFGLGLPQDKEMALKVSYNGYVKGSIPCTIQLGLLSSDNTIKTITKTDVIRLLGKDYQMKWFKNQYDTHKISFDAYNIAYMHLKGYGGAKKSLNDSRKWFEEEKKQLQFLAEQGNANAQVALGNKYNEGSTFVTKDQAKAAEWYHKAARQNNGEAYYRLSNLYLMGTGVTQSTSKYKSYLKKATRYGYVKAK